MFEEEIAKRILEWKSGKKIGPFEVQFNPTNRCNLKCKFCWLRDFDKGKLNYEELSTKKYRELIDCCSKMGVKVIEITGGGEPLMRKDILFLIKRIKRHNMFGRLVTNGTLFSEKLLHELIKIEWDEVIFSLDAPNRKINDYLRGKSFDKIVKAIRTLQIMKIEKGKKKPMVHIHMVLCNKNFHLLPKMFEFARSLNCRNILIEPITLLAKKTRAGKDLLLREEHMNELTKYIKEAVKISHKYNFQTNLDKFELEFELLKGETNRKKIIKKCGSEEKDPWLSLPCYQPFWQMVIRPWGVVGPCCMFDNIGENVNNKLLKEIWFGNYFEKMRERMLKGNLPDFCSKCNPSQIQENRKIRTLLKM